jgi:hypothetical protein
MPTKRMFVGFDARFKENARSYVASGLLVSSGLMAFRLLGSAPPKGGTYSNKPNPTIVEVAFLLQDDDAICCAGSC